MQSSKKGLQGTLSAILAGVVVVAVLSYLIVESRTVEDDYYATQADRVRTIESLEIDIATTVEMMDSTFTSGSEIPTATIAALTRLSQTNERLQGLADFPRSSIALAPLFVGFGDELHELLANGQTFAVKQSAAAAALQALEQEAPILVRDLRDNGFFENSQAVFLLAIDLIEFATDVDPAKALELNQRVSQARVDLAGLLPETSERIGGFLDAAKTIIDEHTAAGMSLQAIAQNNVGERLATLGAAVAAANREVVSRAELARLLLAICAVLLLLGVAFAVLRLQASYKELNRSNRELEIMNTKLEERVAARTEMLSKTNNELRESQVQLIHAEKMSSLGQMVAGISHEINTPLWYLMNNSSVVLERLEVISELCEVTKSMTNAVKTRIAVKESVQKGLMDLHRLLQDGIEEDIEEAKSLVQDSVFGLNELSALAQGLKDFSRLDRAVEGQFDVNDGMDKALLIASNRIKNRIEVHKYYGELPTIYCSPSQINQVFLNLLTNAADAVSGGGDIAIRTWEGDGNVYISISDTGPGIPAEVLPKIRDPFFTTKEIGKGTGLGLSIVDQIMAKHDGELNIQSEPGRGTTVTVTLPISAQVSRGTTNRSDVADPAQVDLAALAASQHPAELPDMAPRLLSA